MSLQLILGSSGSGKSYQLYKEVIANSIKHPENSYLILVPEQFTMQTQKDLVTMHDRQGIMNIDILSFLRLAYRVFEEVGQKEQVVLEDTGKSMLLRKVVAQKQNDLVLFHSNVKKQGFIGELKSLLSEIFQYSISLEQLEQMEKLAKNRPLLQAKLKDITTIYRGFREIIHEKYITAEEVLDVLTEVVDRSKLIQNSVICLDGFTGFTPSQYKLLERLLPLAKKVMVTVTIDKREDILSLGEEFQLFHMSKKTIMKLKEIAIKTNTPMDTNVYANELNEGLAKEMPYRFLNSEPLAALEHNLFRYPFQPYTKEQEDIQIHCALDATQEVNFCIHTIQTYVREKGCRYKDIAIITGDIERYGRIFQREMERAKIPCFIDNKKDILSNPYVELLRSSIEVVLRDFSYESIFRYLRCGIHSMCADDVDVLENYVIALGIRGYGMWTKEWKYTYRWKKPIDLDYINTLRSEVIAKLNPLYQVLSRKDVPVQAYVRALYLFTLDMNVYEVLNEYAEEFQEQNLPILAKEYLQIYKLVMELFDKFVDLLSDEMISLQEFDKILEAGLTEAKVGVIPPRMDQIVIGDITRTRLKDIKVLFLVGVNDGIIPSVNQGGGILSDMDREVFTKNQMELAPTKRQNVYMEQFYLYLNLTKPQNKLYLTYSKISEDGKAMRPSYLIGKIISLFPKLNIIDEERVESLEKILSANGGFEYLVEGLRKYQENEPDDLFKELFSYYVKKPEYKKRLELLVEGAFFTNEDRGISKWVANQLYGNELLGSVTRLEKYAACAFAHFASYGLLLTPRKEYQIEVPDMGNLFHMTLNLFSEKLKESEYTWNTIPEEVRSEWASYCVKVAVEQYGNTVIKSTKRNEYLIERVDRITKRTLWALSEQMKLGAFEPAGYEIPFTYEPEGEKKACPLKLIGRIDRLDQCMEDAVYLKLIDYKSGSTSFDLPSLYYGLQMQLAVYLSAAIQIASKKYQGKEVIPAGILYYHINDPIVDRTSDVEAEVLKQLRMNGLVSSDMDVVKLLDRNFAGNNGVTNPKVKSKVFPVETNKDGIPTKRSSIATKREFQAIADYVNDKMLAISSEIMEGNTKVNPYKLGDKTACDYCEYSGVCGFDTKLPGYKYRKLRAIDKEMAMEAIKEGQQEDEVDERAATSHRCEEP